MGGVLMLIEAVLALTCAATPGDVSEVQSLMELAANQAAHPALPRGDFVPTGLLLAALAQAEALLEQDGVPFDGASQEWLRERLIRRLEAELWRMPAEPGPARREAWDQLVREVTTPQLAQQVLDAWLEMPPLTPLEAPVVKGAWPQASQLEAGDSFTLERVAVVEEVGSAGQVNQLIDPGEWVRLEITFLNATKQPWFSTSGLPQASGCLWVDQKRSSLVGEMAPGGRARVSIWAYVPERCFEPSTLRIALSDTHRGTLAGALTIALDPTSFTRPHAVQTRLDTDPLGSSDGSRLTQVGPAMRFEFVADVRITGEAVTSVVTRWNVPSRARALFKSLTFREAPAVPQGMGIFAAGDDLDGETVNEDAWAELAQGASLERWMLTPATGRVWLAMDTTVELSAAQPRLAPPPAPPTRGPRGPTLMSAVRNTPPAGTTVAELVKQYVVLEPHGVVREKPNAVQAVSGYELIFDRDGFMKAYEALLAPPASWVPAHETPTARYLVRSYLAIPAVPVERVAPVLKPMPPAEQPPPLPRPVPAPRTWLQLDVGGGFSVFATQATADRPQLWTGAQVAGFPALGVRAFIGPHLVGVLAFNYLTRTNALSVLPSTFIELSGDLGLGYRFSWTRFSLTPYAGLLLRQRSHSLVGNDVGSLGGVVALNARIVFTSWLGLSLDLGVPLALGGPTGFARNQLEVPIVSGIGLRTTLNASIAF